MHVSGGGAPEGVPIMNSRDVSGNLLVSGQGPVKKKVDLDASERLRFAFEFWGHTAEVVLRARVQLTWT